MKSICLALIVLATILNSLNLSDAYKLVDILPNKLQFSNKNSDFYINGDDETSSDSIRYPANIREDDLFGDKLDDQFRRLLELSGSEHGDGYKKNRGTFPTLGHFVSDDEDVADDIEPRQEDLVELDDIKSQDIFDPKQIRDEEETESHSSLVAGHQYVSGGAGEGKQHLQPDGSVPNKEEVKSDEDLPAYCDPPNPCPLGYNGEDCDSRPYGEYTAEYSKHYQEQQNCMCDDDHNECPKSTRSKPTDKFGVNELIQSVQMSKNNLSPVVAKKSPRVKRNV